MTEDDDQDLRRRFRALREEDARDAPDFAFLWRSAQARSRHRAFSPLVPWTVAAGVAFMLLLVVFGLRHHPVPPPHARATSAPSLSEWRPSTDFLLRTPAVEVLTTVPVLGAASLPPRPSLPIERSSPS